MTQPGFNHGFTDEDAAFLYHVAPFANHPHHRYYPCGWTTGQGICSVPVQCSGFPEHLRSYHSISGPEKDKVTCNWVGCSIEMKRESLTRHINEKHLELRYPCPNCPEQFTRPYTMQNHVTKRHTGN